MGRHERFRAIPFRQLEEDLAGAAVPPRAVPAVAAAFYCHGQQLAFHARLAKPLAELRAHYASMPGARHFANPSVPGNVEYPPGIEAALEDDDAEPSAETADARALEEVASRFADNLTALESTIRWPSIRARAFTDVALDLDVDRYGQISSAKILELVLVEAIDDAHRESRKFQAPRARAEQDAVELLMKWRHRKRRPTQTAFSKMVRESRRDIIEHWVKLLENVESEDRFDADRVSEWLSETPWKWLVEVFNEQADRLRASRAHVVLPKGRDVPEVF